LGVTLRELQEAVEKHLNHRKLLADFKKPALFLHARYDDLVPVDNAERLHAWASGRTSLTIFERGDHNSILMFNFEAYMSKVKEFVESLVNHG
jgi:pimeloyl-ACP methyl ester carboxylesterase